MWLLIGFPTNYLKLSFFLQAGQVIYSRRVSRSTRAPHLGQKSDWKSSIAVKFFVIVDIIN